MELEKLRVNNEGKGIGSWIHSNPRHIGSERMVNGWIRELPSRSCRAPVKQMSWRNELPRGNICRGTKIQIAATRFRTMLKSRP